MYKETKRAAAVLGGLVLVAGGIAVANTAITNSASAAGCYDGAKTFYKVIGSYYYPRYASSPKLVTTSRCNDINVKISNSTGRGVKVCFYPSSGSSYCQKDFTWATPGKWKVIATNVKDNTKFRLRFTSSTNTAAGSYAS